MVAANAATGANGHKLVFNDCAVAPSSTTTTTDANTGSGDNCTTVAQVGSNNTLTVTLTDANGAPINNQTIDFTTSGETGATPNSANFPLAQPPGGSQTATTGATAACTTGVAGNPPGQCSVNLTDSEAETVTVTATERVVGGATATETVDFRTGSVAASRLDQVANQVISPENDTPQTADNPTNRPTYDGNGPTPGRPEQLTYTVRDLNTSGSDGSNCVAAAGNTPDNFSTCTGGRLPNVTLTVKTTGTAFFTPNCQPRDASNTGTPLRSTTPGTPAGPNNVPPAAPSQGTLVAPRYHTCTFNTTPADGVVTGSLKNSGQSLTVTTDKNGQFTVTVAIERDPGFDDDGIVLTQISATTSGGSTLTARQPGGTNAGTGSNCTAGNGTSAGAIGFVSQQQPPGAPISGCNTPVEFRTRGTPLNGGNVSIVRVASGTFSGNGQAATSNNGGLSNTGTNNVPNNQFRIFVVHMTDQFGNLVRAFNDEATITKSGVGNIYECNGTPNSADPCPSPQVVTQTQDQNSSTSFTGSQDTAGSWTNLEQQDRFAIDAEQSNSTGFLNCNNSQFGNCTFVVGDMTVSVTWPAPVTTFDYAGTPTAWVGYHYSTASKTDKVTVHWYNQVAQAVVTFSTTPGNTVTRGTAVTVTATVVDQFGTPIQNLPVQFLRGGANEQSCNPTYPNGYVANTNAQGKAGFSFTCNSAGTSTVTVIVTDGSGNEIARGVQKVTFTAPRAARTHIAASINCTSPRAHHVKCKVHVSPRFAGLTVVFRNAKGHIVGRATTNSHGNAYYRKGHLRSGSHHTYHAHVKRSSRTFGANTGSDGVTVK